MGQHQTVNVKAGSLQGDWLRQVVTHLSSNSRMGYFLWLNESTRTINVANALANIITSNTVMAPRAHTMWVMQTLPHDAANLVCPLQLK